MNKKFLSAILFGALMVTSTGTFVSCKDYDDDIDRLDQEISNVKDAIKALEDKVGSGKYVESCTPFTDGNGGYEIKFSDGETIKLYNGAKGEQGEYDIAFCVRSIREDIGEEQYVELFFDLLGIKPDWEKIKYYILLDELF